MMKSHENDLAAGFAQQLDNVISERDCQRARKQTEYTKQRLLVENFVVRASAAISLAVEAINARAHDLRFDSPVRVDTTCDFKNDTELELALGNDSMSATLTVSMTRARRDREREIPDRGASASYSWNLYTSVCVGNHGDTESASSRRQRWQAFVRTSWRSHCRRSASTTSSRCCPRRVVRREPVAVTGVARAQADRRDDALRACRGGAPTRSPRGRV